jgi:phosphoribosylformylglycinamidine cyclo-ligase
MKEIAMTSITYQDAGVDIDYADRSIKCLIPSRSRSKHVIASPHDFAGLFSIKELVKHYDDPVLVASTDGVGTKVLAAIACESYDGLGQDLVAMCANDILTKGALPLFFLDYFATANLKSVPFSRLVNSMTEACEEIDCALIGGETAEMPALYAHKHFDLAGFIVGVAERSKMLGRHLVKEGDAVIGIASSGLHANGFSLVRKIMFENLKHRANDVLWQSEKSVSTVADELLRPTILYQHCITALRNAGVKLNALAHITGGGLLGNVPRILPAHLTAELDISHIKIPNIFSYLAKNGPVDEQEMLRTFNMGIGMVAVVDAGLQSLALDIIKANHQIGYEIGIIKVNEGSQRCQVKM